MDKFYVIDYEVDTGFNRVRDKALVLADCKNIAKYKLCEAVEKIAVEYIVTHFYSVEEIHGSVFSVKFGIHT